MLLITEYDVEKHGLRASELQVNLKHWTQCENVLRASQLILRVYWGDIRKF